MKLNFKGVNFPLSLSLFQHNLLFITSLWSSAGFPLPPSYRLFILFSTLPSSTLIPSKSRLTFSRTPTRNNFSTFSPCHEIYLPNCPGPPNFCSCNSLINNFESSIPKYYFCLFLDYIVTCLY